MEKKGYVSLWIGNVVSEELLEEYLELFYNDEGEWELSDFLGDYNINLDDFDEDFVEHIYFEDEIKCLEELLEGCSYDEIVLPQFRKSITLNNKKKFNAAILLYNFQYDGNVKMYERKNCKFEFVGSAKYE